MSSRRFLTAGSASASLSAAFNFVIASFGVPFGAQKACQMDM